MRIVLQQQDGTLVPGVRCERPDCHKAMILPEGRRGPAKWCSKSCRQIMYARRHGLNSRPSGTRRKK